MEDYYGIKSRRAREYIRSLPFKKKIPWKVMFPKTSDLALDLLERLLAFNPVKRITVEEALKHPYLEPYHDPDDEPTADPIPEEFFDFDKNKDNLSKEQLKRKWRFSVWDSCAWLTPNSLDLPGDHEVDQVTKGHVSQFRGLDIAGSCGFPTIASLHSGLMLRKILFAYSLLISSPRVLATLVGSHSPPSSVCVRHDA